MNKTKTSKPLNVWSAGLTLILSAAAVAASLWLFSLWAKPSVWADSAGRKESYYVYGLTLTSDGDHWVFLGAYDDVYAAAKVAAAAKTGKDCGHCWDSKILSASRLALPPAGDRVVYRLDRGSGQAWENVGTYRTPAQATAAAEQIVADGDRFEVIYDRVSN